MCRQHVGVLCEWSRGVPPTHSPQTSHGRLCTQHTYSKLDTHTRVWPAPIAHMQFLWSYGVTRSHQSHLGATPCLRGMTTTQSLTISVRTLDVHVCRHACAHALTFSSHGFDKPRSHFLFTTGTYVMMHHTKKIRSEHSYAVISTHAISRHSHKRVHTRRPNTTPTIITKQSHHASTNNSTHKKTQANA